ncbi:MAG: hypothetical protein CL816_03845 [Coxiellaceae bacterium]|nr:hypothetical protein [Coxiellaceae bacterium]|tara:strand:- start:7652 stop:8176 length:525 start_codon:yes stop_codon:yes gene_type:complete
MLINLFPYRSRKKKQQLKKNMVISCLTGLSITVLCLIKTHVLIQDTALADQTIISLKKTKKTLSGEWTKQRCDEQKKISQSTKKTEQNLKHQYCLTKTSPMITESIPKSITLQSLTINDNTLALIGKGSSPKHIHTLTNLLSRIKTIDDVTIHHIHALEDSSQFEFELEAQLQC